MIAASPLLATNLCKSYGTTLAVDNVSFRVERGELLALLGPNGSGKSTILRAVGGTLRLDAGRVELVGIDLERDPRNAKRRLGVVHQEDTLDPDLTVRENLLVYGRYFDLPARQTAARAVELMDRFGLADRAHQGIDELSGGMRRRLMLARAFFQCEVLILDEPTTGLDPEARLVFWADLRALLATGVAILLTTHDMEEAERLADRVIMLDHGKARMEGSPAALISGQTTGKVYEIRLPVHRLHEAPSLVVDMEAILVDDTRRRVTRHGGFLFCETGEPDRVRSWAADRGLPLTERPANLGDIYLRMTGQVLEE